MDIILTALVGAFLTLLCCGGAIVVGYLRQPNGFAMLRNAAREIAGGWVLAAALYMEREVLRQ